MTGISRLRIAVALSQSAVATVFGVVGTWQRNRILSQPFVEGETLWNSTARFHVWPWQLKFAVIENFPAFFATAILSLPARLVWPQAPDQIDYLILAPLAFVLWYWIGSRVKDPVRLLVLVGLSGVLAAAGAFLPLGHVGYVPYGIALWIVTAAIIWSRRMNRGS